MTPEGMIFATVLVAMIIGGVAIALFWVWLTTEALDLGRWTPAIVIGPFLVFAWVAFARMYSI